LKIAIIVLSLFFAVGIFKTCEGTINILESTKASEWPTTEGEMNACELKKLDAEEGYSWKVIARYSYRISGHSYSGQRIAFGYSDSSNYATHSTLYKKLSGARTVTVRYNPSNPNESVLSYGLNHSSIFTLVFGIIWLLFMTGFTLPFFFYRKRTRLLDRIEILLPKSSEKQIEATL